MSGMDQFLAQHFGNAPDPEPTAEDVEKVAQAEMFLKLAAEQGVDINNLTNAQVDELWQATWNQEKAAEFPPKKEEGGEHEDKESPKEESTEEKAKKEHEEKKAEAESVKEAQAKFAEAEDMGKIMAHSYVAELRGIAETGALDFLKESAPAMAEVNAPGARAVAQRAGAAVSRAGKAVWEKAKGGYEAVAKPVSEKRKKLMEEGERMSQVRSEKGGKEYLRSSMGKSGLKEIIKGHAAHYAPHAAGGLAAGTAVGVGAKKIQKEKEKSSSINLDIISANMALQKLAADGWDLEEGQALLQNLINEGPADSEKIAHVTDFDSAVDVRSSELLEEAGYPVDWTGTPFEKSAEEPHVPGHSSSKAPETHRLRAAGEWVAGHGKKGWEAVKRHKGAIGAIGGAAALGTAAGYAASGKRKESSAQEELPAEVQFDLEAGELAVTKVAEAGWNAEEATNLLNAVLTLGHQGDPTESEKVAQAQNEEQALDFRACELLELAGYTINW